MTLSAVQFAFGRERISFEVRAKPAIRVNVSSIDDENYYVVDLNGSLSADERWVYSRHLGFHLMMAVKMWEAQTGTQLFTLTAHNNWVRSSAYSPDGQRIVTGGWDKTAKVWEQIQARN